MASWTHQTGFPLVTLSFADGGGSGSVGKEDDDDPDDKSDDDDDDDNNIGNGDDDDDSGGGSGIGSRKQLRLMAEQVRALSLRPRLLPCFSFPPISFCRRFS